VYGNATLSQARGVLRGWSAEKRKLWAKISLKLFLACVVLDWVSRFRHRQLREERKEEEVISAIMSEERGGLVEESHY
jgi:hypothetical protein